MSKCVIASTLFIALKSHALEPTYTISSTLASDGLYHGITETTGNPVLAFSGEIHPTANIYIGLTAHAASNDDLSQRHLSYTSYIGFELPVTNAGWVTGLAAKSRKFVESQKDWDYTEFTAHARHESGLSLQLDYANNYYNYETRATVLQLGYANQISSQLYTRSTLGYVELSDRQSYAFASVALGWMSGRNNLEISYNWHNLERLRRFRETVQNIGLKLQLSHRWW